jgi:hypothetical protein
MHQRLYLQGGVKIELHITSALKPVNIRPWVNIRNMLQYLTLDVTLIHRYEVGMIKLIS